MVQRTRRAGSRRAARVRSAAMASASSPAASTAPRVPWRVPWLVGAAAAPAFLVKVKDSDVWWHLATGRWIGDHGHLPTTDPFTYTMQGHPWRPVNALADLLLYGAERTFGANGIIGLKVLCAWLTLGFVGLALREVGASRVTLVATTLACALLLHGRYTLDRPLVLGAVLLAACQYAALRSQLRQDRSHYLFLGALPLWPLVHPTALLGLGQLVVLLGAACIGGAKRRRRLSLGATLAGCVALSLILPWWRQTYEVAAQLGAHATATQFTAEWRTSREALRDRAGHWAMVLVALAGGALSLRKNALLLGCTLIAAAISYQFARNAYEGVILCAPACAVGLERAAQPLRARGHRFLADLSPGLAALGIALGQLALAPTSTIGGPFGLGVEQGRFPYDTLETLRRLPVHRLFNDFPTGGFLIWQSGPWGVYCDGRTVSLYQEEDVQRLFVPQMQSEEALTRAADSWNAPYGLNEHGSPPNHWMMVSRDWVPVHLGTSTTLFVRTTILGELPPDVVPLHLVRYTSDAAWTEGFYRGILQDPNLRAQLRREFAQASTRGPSSPVLVEIVRLLARLDGEYAAELARLLVAARSASAR
jgi:hypothetical protein